MLRANVLFSLLLLTARSGLMYVMNPIHIVFSLILFNFEIRNKFLEIL